MEKGLIIVISGPAGSGKGTVNAHLLKTGDFVYSVSATTRAPRPGEVDGVNYYFVTREDFEKRIAEGGMLEHTEYCGNYYGTPKKEAERINAANLRRSSGSLVAADVDYFSPAEVRAMSQADVRKNYQKIMQSMQKWR